MRGEFAGDAVMGGGLVCWCMVRSTSRRLRSSWQYQWMLEAFKDCGSLCEVINFPQELQAT